MTSTLLAIDDVDVEEFVEYYGLQYLQHRCANFISSLMLEVIFIYETMMKKLKPI